MRRTATTNVSESLGKDKELGAVAPDYFADIVAVEGDPLTNIDVAIYKVKCVMKSGAVVADKSNVNPVRIVESELGCAEGGAR